MTPLLYELILLINFCPLAEESAEADSTEIIEIVINKPCFKIIQIISKIYLCQQV